MPDIDVSLTTFVDFVAAVGPARITVARDAKKQYAEDYEPTFDYWRLLRIAIIRMHAENGDPRQLDELLNQVGVSKRANYEQRIRAHRTWIGKKTILSKLRRSARWRAGDLVVHVNPELSIDIDGRHHVVKLYFKADAIAKYRVDATLHLLSSTVGHGANVGILDVMRSRLVVPTRPIAGIDGLLSAEAAALVQLWRSV